VRKEASLVVSIRIVTEPAIDWMHPSWRDLVIEQLVTDDNARQHFLKNCGLPGFLLALSVAGGATGTRAMPLLCRREDWSALSHAAPDVLRSGNDASAKILASLYAALTTLSGIYSITSPMGAFANHVLAVLRELWGNNQQQPSAVELERYYAVSQALQPLPPGPNLEPIWTRSYKAANKQAAGFKTDERWPELADVLNWLNLVQVIMENEPRFVRQIGLPAKFLEFAKDLLDQVKLRGERRFELDSPDYCAIEEGQLDLLHTIAHQVGSAFPSLKATAKEVKRKIWENASRVEQLRRQLEEEARESDDEQQERDDYSGDEPDPEERTILDEYVNVDQLFADL